jgi:hypothetical protein
MKPGFVDVYRDDGFEAVRCRNRPIATSAAEID